MSQIKPVLGHALTEAGMVKQAVDQFAKRIGTLVDKKGIDFIRGWRQTVQIVGEAAYQGASVGLWRKLQTVLL